MTKSQPLTLRIEVRPSPSTSDFEVRLFAGYENLIDRIDNSLIGLDPDDILRGDRLLDTSSRVTIARCDCGQIGCGSAEVRIERDGEFIEWHESHRDVRLRFRADKYTAEVRRAATDFSWETKDRTASRKIAETVDRAALARRGLTFDWASGRCQPNHMSASLHAGDDQVLVNHRWDGEDVETVTREVCDLLQTDPATWPYVVFYGPGKLPAMAGAGWRRG